jgi:hypothetical protein
MEKSKPAMVMNIVRIKRSCKGSFYTLKKNSLTVILSPTNKDRIQAYVAVKAGSKQISNTYWFSTLFRAYAFKGTDKYGTQDSIKKKSN